MNGGLTPPMHAWCLITYFAINLIAIYNIKLNAAKPLTPSRPQNSPKHPP